MADDGMLLNFDLGSVAVNQQVKFKGGNWRDRKLAQRSAKRQQETGSSKTDATGESNRDRPLKRRRVEGGGEGNRAGAEERPSGRSEGHQGWQGSSAQRGKPQNGVTSRLFTSNPTPVTDFTSSTAAADAEPVQPSNAPLSEEASTFLKLGLSRRVAQHLSTKMGLKAPTAIQHSAVPQLVSQDSDAFIQAETGSGKTLAYLLPLVQRILALSEQQQRDSAEGGEGENEKAMPRRSKDGKDGKSVAPLKVHRNSGLFAIILAPTRELCKQISVVLEKLLRCAPWLVSTTVIGGESKKSEKARIRKGVNILIATPGRLTDHLDHTEVLDVGTVRWLVLDEGDRLMEMGFEEDIRMIVGQIRKKSLQNMSKDGLVLPAGVLPERRVTVLCSATMKMNVQKLGEISLEDAVHISAARGTGDSEATGGASASETAVFAAPAQLKQTYIVVPAKLRLVTLLSLLRSTFARKGSVMKAIIFISCADSVDFHFDLLKSSSTVEEVKDEDEEDVEDVGSDTASNSNESIDDDSDDDKAGKANAKKAAKRKSPSNQTKSARSNTAATVAPAAYITSPANRTIVLHKLHGSLAQPVRTATLAAFSQEKNPAVLVTTDISSRGLDVPAVDLVIEYDPAFAVADHLHRIGRTARAGRPGKAILFLQPGTEEGYVGLLQKSSSSASSASSSASSVLTPQNYDSVLQAGFAGPIDMPLLSEKDKAALDPDHDPSRPNISWSKRAEALQLHLEQRLLAVESASAPELAKNKGKFGKVNGKNKGKGRREMATVQDSKLLDAARQAFRSHIRAYATHVREERVFFDMTQLHLGHMAKSFGLREAPGGIGGGVQRRSKKPTTAATAKSSRGGDHAGRSGHGSRGGHNSDDEGGGAADEDAARRMRQKMMSVMSASAEFNIG